MMASTQSGMSEPKARSCPTGMSHVLLSTNRCLTTFGSGPRSFSMSYGSYWMTPMVLLPLSGALLSDPASV